MKAFMRQWKMRLRHSNKKTNFSLHLIQNMIYFKRRGTINCIGRKGRALFFNKAQTNCSSCHQLQSAANHQEETFSNYHYYNVGVPGNPDLIAVNGFAPDFVDLGLFENPNVKGDETQKANSKPQHCVMLP